MSNVGYTIVPFLRDLPSVRSLLCEWAVSCLAPTEATSELAALILGDVVIRIVQGPEQSRQGLVAGKLAHGSVLSLRDVFTRRTVSHIL